MISFISMDGLRVLCVLLIIESDVVKCNLALRKLEVESISAIECTASSDIKINYIKGNITQRIVECNKAVNACFLIESSLGKYYAVSYTGSGLIFYVINSFPETHGTYKCCEAKNELNCISTDIGLPGNSHTIDTSEINQAIAPAERKGHSYDNQLLVAILAVCVTHIFLHIASVVLHALKTRRLLPCMDSGGNKYTVEEISLNKKAVQETQEQWAEINLADRNIRMQITESFLKRIATSVAGFDDAYITTPKPLTKLKGATIEKVPTNKEMRTQSAGFLQGNGNERTDWGSEDDPLTFVASEQVADETHAV